MLIFLRSALLGSSLLLLSACGLEYTCSTYEGPAHWSGKCIQGIAQGDGVATYEDSYIATLKGYLVDGVPNGKVNITYSEGGSYHGEMKDGEYHGFGIDMEPWGEGFEGNWVDGFKDGEGVYINVDGTRIEGVWRRGVGLVGAWYTDLGTGCKLWWSAAETPTGTVSWSGECVGGKANGPGTVKWAADAEDVDATLRSEATFYGALDAGRLQGPGNWQQTREYRNSIVSITIDGRWDNGELNGAVEYERVSRHNGMGGFSTTTTYRGEFGNGVFAGYGKREEMKEHPDGRLEKLTEEGQFADNMLNGEGTRIEEKTNNNGDLTFESSTGYFSDRHFRGHGDQTVEHKSETGRFLALLSYPAHNEDGGTGTIRYANADLFEGSVDSWGTPIEGTCELTSVDYTGPCIARSKKTSDYSGVTCLVSPENENNCLKEIISWVS